MKLKYSNQAGFIHYSFILLSLIVLIVLGFTLTSSNFFGDFIHNKVMAATNTVSRFILGSGQAGTVKCNGNYLSAIRTSRTEFNLNCAPSASASPSPTPTMTPSPLASASPMGGVDMSGTGKCGEPMDRWHPPVITQAYKDKLKSYFTSKGQPFNYENMQVGCATGHEHGDEPPQWILDAGYDPMYMGHFNTSAIENTTKHTSMKGYLTRFNNSDIYIRVHLASNPMERFGRYHSYEAFAKDSTGAVSHWQLWQTFGDPLSTDDRCPSRSNQECDSGSHAIIIVSDDTSLTQGLGCETWYSKTFSQEASWGWSVGWTICGTTTVYQRDKEQDQATVFDQSTWKKTGQLGLTRRIELTFNKSNLPKTGKFWTTQFGELVSGPNDPKCLSTSTKYGTTYQNLCLEQNIAPTMPSVGFPHNSIQRTFPGQGVQIPN